MFDFDPRDSDDARECDRDGIYDLPDGSRRIRVAVREKGRPSRIRQWLELREIRVHVGRRGFRQQELRVWTSHARIRTVFVGPLAFRDFLSWSGAHRSDPLANSRTRKFLARQTSARQLPGIREADDRSCDSHRMPAFSAKPRMPRPFVIDITHVSGDSTVARPAVPARRVSLTSNSGGKRSFTELAWA